MSEFKVELVRAENNVFLGRDRIGFPERETMNITVRLEGMVSAQVELNGMYLANNHDLHWASRHLGGQSMHELRRDAAEAERRYRDHMVEQLVRNVSDYVRKQIMDQLYQRADEVRRPKVAPVIDAFQKKDY